LKKEKRNKIKQTEKKIHKRSGKKEKKEEREGKDKEAEI
jgi:hypothetical protein